LPETCDCLQPGKWLNDEIINGYAQLIQDTAEPNVVIFSSFFLSRLADRGWKSVKKEWLKVSDLHDTQQSTLHDPQKVGDGLHNGQLSKIIFPISEPVYVTAPEQQHWTMGVIDCSCHEITYVNGKKEIGRFGDFKRVCHSLECEMVVGNDQLVKLL
jgi:Ulp1 family protease